MTADDGSCDMLSSAIVLSQMCMAETATKEIVRALDDFPRDAYIQHNGFRALAYMLKVKLDPLNCNISCGCTMYWGFSRAFTRASA